MDLGPYCCLVGHPTRLNRRWKIKSDLVPRRLIRFLCWTVVCLVGPPRPAQPNLLISLIYFLRRGGSFNRNYSGGSKQQSNRGNGLNGVEHWLPICHRYVADHQTKSSLAPALRETLICRSPRLVSDSEM
jgi:hypothetical protein